MDNTDIMKKVLKSELAVSTEPAVNSAQGGTPRKTLGLAVALELSGELHVELPAEHSKARAAAAGEQAPC